MTTIARRDIGLQDNNGNWTGKYGIHSAEDFLNSSEAQERAFADYMKKTDRYINYYEFDKLIGQQIGGLNGPIEITQNGLAAALHRQGPGAVQEYLEYKKGKGWKSNFDGLEDKKKAAFLAIETRLREFQDIPYRQGE